MRQHAGKQLGTRHPARAKPDRRCAQDYFDIVKHPMDLETVGKKLEHKPERGVVRQYREPGEFRDDMRQIWTNCRLYNAVGTPVRGMVRPTAPLRPTGGHRRWYACGGAVAEGSGAPV